MRRGGGGSNRSVSGIHQSQYHQQQSQPSFAHGLSSGSHHRVHQANAAAAAAAAAASVNVTFDRRISEADAYLVLLLEQQQAFEARYKTLRMQTDAEAKRGKTGICFLFFAQRFATSKPIGHQNQRGY